MYCKRMIVWAAMVLVLFGYRNMTHAQASINVNADAMGINVSPTLYGIFFEDINWAADGGLYAELVQNRSFEYINAFNSNFTPKTSWTLVTRGGANGSMVIDSANPINATNKHYCTISIVNQGSGIGLSNEGFVGIPVKNGETYDFSCWLKRGNDLSTPVAITIESKSGTVLGSAEISSIATNWKKYTTTITTNATDNDARLVILFKGSSQANIDMISLFPQKTYKNHVNGLRADLAKRIQDMKPSFVRFPGGCIVHSNNIATAYRWKTTIGPLEERKYNPNRWGYMQSGGLGFYEYFQFCEDLGAEPVPVLPCGVSCHYEYPYEQVPLAELQPWINDALDLIEYANGSVTSTWGAKRAAAGHPEPFNMKYIGVGNEEWGQEFKDRSTMFISAIRQKYPAIKIIGTAGPSPDGTDFTDLWAYNKTQKTNLVDEHYYSSTSFFISGTHRYDNYDRKGPLAFAGEYASNSPGIKRLSNAVAEAAFLTGLEKNSDVVAMSCYAPLFCNVNCNGAPAKQSWNPDLIYFDNNKSYVTPSYLTQSLFANNVGQRLLASTNSNANGPLYCVASKDTATSEIFLKVVNTSAQQQKSTITITTKDKMKSTGTLTVLTSSNADNENSFADSQKVAITSTALTGVSTSIQQTFVPNSVNVVKVALDVPVGIKTMQKKYDGSDVLKINWCKVEGSRSKRKLLMSIDNKIECRVKIELYSSNGKKVALMPYAVLPKGMHTVPMSFSEDKNLSTGVYIVSVFMGMGGQIVSQKIVL